MTQTKATAQGDTERRPRLDQHARALLYANLALTPEQRFEKFLKGLAFLAELRRARKVARDG